MAESKTLTKKDFKSDQEVRWCPGCGDYAILNAVQSVCADLGLAREKTVFVSGIGCSSRFPYYMNTYGFHTIHGRAPAVASGVKMVNPELSVWVVTGDGDGLSIGGNHLLHLLRRNLDINVLLFNNQIYGLTKGQYSPTSPHGKKTKTSPMGAVDHPVDPVAFACGAGATFIARTIDTHIKHMQGVLEAAAKHHGTSFVEIYQNCVIFNDKAFDSFAEKGVRDDKTIDLVPGQPMVFGKQHDKGLRLRGWGVEVCSAEEADTWDPSTSSAAPALIMSQLDDDPSMPRPIGILRSVDLAVYEDEMHEHSRESIEKRGRGTLQDLIYSGETWTVD